MLKSFIGIKCLIHSIQLNKYMLIPREMEGKREVKGFKNISNPRSGRDEKNLNVKLRHITKKKQIAITLCCKCTTDFSVANM